MRLFKNKSSEHQTTLIQLHLIVPLRSLVVRECLGCCSESSMFAFSKSSCGLTLRRALHKTEE